MPKTKQRRKRTPRYLHDRTFLSVKDLQAYVRDMLKSRVLNQPFLRELLKYHRDLERKMGNRVLSCFRASEWNSCQALLLVFEDGEEDSISWLQMCKMVFATDKQRARIDLSNAVFDMKQAARQEVRDQTRGFRAQHPGYEDGTQFHVGHDYENGKRFNEILHDFLEEKNVVVETEKIPQTWHWKFKDRELAAEWSAYHRKHAILRMETASDNLRGNKGFQKSTWGQKFVTTDAQRQRIARNRAEAMEKKRSKELRELGGVR